MIAFLITAFILAIFIVIIVAFFQSAPIPEENFESFNPESLLDFPRENPDSKRYFELMGIIFQEKKNGNFPEALDTCRKSLLFLPAVLKDKDLLDDEGEIALGSIPAIQEGFNLAAILQNRGALNEIKSFIEAAPGLKKWIGLIEEAEEEFSLIPRITQTIQKNPGIRQDKIKYEMQYVDGRKIATLIARMEKGGFLRRERNKKNLLVYPK